MQPHGDDLMTPRMTRGEADYKVVMQGREEAEPGTKVKYVMYSGTARRE